MECTKLGPTDIDISRICFETLWVGGVEESDAIAWTLAQSGITSALIAAKSPQQIDENIPAADVKLNAEDLYRIDDVLS